MDAQKDFDHLFEELSKGDREPGLYNKVLTGTKDVRYARGRNGGRLFFRVTEEGVEIVGKADKGNESKVIARLEKLFAK
ncbi:hypothetical protein ACFYNY_24165 [Streptomyces sp. NPDC006530]|uniref:hypothetical protein n=1 Tax=Streptomyces sp. NPDC006530 TaxID=3364750 RepID=UPI00367DC803